MLSWTYAAAWVTLPVAANWRGLAATSQVVGCEARGFGEVERRVGDSEGELLVEAGLFDLGPELDVVPAGDDGEVAARSPVEQCAMLRDGGGLVEERVAAGVVVDHDRAGPTG